MQCHSAHFDENSTFSRHFFEHWVEIEMLSLSSSIDWKCSRAGLWDKIQASTEQKDHKIEQVDIPYSEAINYIFIYNIYFYLKSVPGKIIISIVYCTFLKCTIESDVAKKTRIAADAQQDDDDGSRLSNGGSPGKFSVPMMFVPSFSLKISVLSVLFYG